MDAALDQFRGAMVARGLAAPGEIIADGKIHRCKIEGRTTGEDGAYLIHLDRIPAGGIQNHADGLGWEDWRAEMGRQLTPKEQISYQERIDTAKKAREAEAARLRVAAATKARKMVQDAKPCEDHAYLTRKGIQAHGVGVLDGNLVVPLYTPSGKLASTQTIAPDGTKRFLKDGRKQGCSFLLGVPGPGPLCITEGFATAATIHEATGHAVAVAFDCGNLAPVAKAMKAAYPKAELVICADDDMTPGNPGMTNAKEAAKAVNGRVVSPDWNGNQPDGATDFNDLAQIRGLEAVRECFFEPSADDAPKKVSEPEHPERPNINGFQWEMTGLCCISQKKNEEGQLVEVLEWIAPPFTLPGNVRDSESEKWGFLVAWNDLDHVHHEEVIHNEDLAGDGLEIFRVLARGGMVLSPNLKLRKKLLEYLTRAIMKVKARVRTVETLGWIDEGQAFVLPDGGVIGQAAEALLYAGARRRAPKTKGTLIGWQNGVARYAVGNPYLAFAVACAFTGPLLAILRPDGSGGFNLQGSSSKGKSTCLESAVSVWCNPHPLPSWRATSNGLEVLCAARNDGFLVLDELSQIDPREAGQAAYLIANGRDKARMSKTGEAKMPKEWRILFLSSGEQTLGDKLSEDGKRIRAGHEVRVVDIPCGPEGLFENSHELPSMGHLAENLKIQARNHYGHAAHAYLENLCNEWEDWDAMTAKLKTMESAWLADTVPLGADGQVRRVAARFALVAVAGELACTMGILPWPTGEASSAARMCFMAWLNRRGHIGASECERGLRAVVDFLSLHGLSRFAEWSNTDARPANMAGVRREAQPDGWDFYISPTGWKEITKGFDAREVGRAAIAEGLLEPGGKGEPYQKERTPHGQGRWYIVRSTGLGAFREASA